MKTSKKDHSHRKKGQSAIEYLMTYGWMLLVVAIVGGAIFATVNNQRSSCQGDIPRAMMPGQNDGFGIDQFAITSSGAQIVLSNQGTEEVNVTQVSLGTVTNNSYVTIPVSGERTYQLTSVSTADSCSSADLSITYDVGQISGQSVSGEISAEMSGVS